MAVAVPHNVGPRHRFDVRQADWRRGLPELSDGEILLRELRWEDARPLFVHLNDPMVLKYIAPCPTTLVGFQQFIRWTHDERRGGRHACFGVVPFGMAVPVGILQVWPIERDFSTAEWGFVLGRAHWGTGLFVRSASMLLDAVFADGLFGPPGVYRLESRAVEANARGNAVLRKLGATREGVLRGAFWNGGRPIDHVMWSILAPEWLAVRGQAHGGE